MFEDREFDFSSFDIEEQVVNRINTENESISKPQSTSKKTTYQKRYSSKRNKKKSVVKKEEKKTEKKEVKKETKKEPKKVVKKKKLKLSFNKTVKKESKPKKQDDVKKTQVPKEEKRTIIDVTPRYNGRYTEPKKRNLLSRIILQERLARDGFDYIEDGYDVYVQDEIDASKNAKKRRDRRFYKEVQAYEDAIDDVTARRGWLGFKIGLAAVMLATTVAITAHTVNEVKEMMSSSSGYQTVTVESMNEEQRSEYDSIINNFLNQVREKDGYEFDTLTQEELIDGYIKILNKEKHMVENQFKGAYLKDQELLDKIVSRAFGEEYESFTEEQKREYRQLAFELLPIALPDLSEEGTMFLRNPIVYDALQAKNVASEKGYKMTLKVNADEEETVKTIGKMIHIVKMLDEDDYIEASSINNGQGLLDEIISEALGDKYQELSEKELKDYKQLAYEFLSDDAKDKYVKDPIELEKEANEEIEIGE